MSIFTAKPIYRQPDNAAVQLGFAVLAGALFVFAVCVIAT